MNTHVRVWVGECIHFIFVVVIKAIIKDTWFDGLTTITATTSTAADNVMIKMLVAGLNEI
jgi:hypothetical protein